MSVGATLAQAREERGLSVEDVSGATRIRGGLIRSIERDDFSGVGGAVYARGHIRSISRVIGIDPEPLVAEFDREHSDEAAPAPVVPAPGMDPHEAARADRKRPNWAAAMGVALVAICVLAAVSLIGGGGSSNSPVAQDQPTVTHSPTPSPPVSPPASPPPSAVAQVPAGQAVAMVRVVSSRTWLSVTTFSGKLLFQGLLAGGDRRVFRDAKGLNLTIGNAPVVDLVANGQDVGAPRSQGNVAHVTIARGGGIQYA